MIESTGMSGRLPVLFAQRERAAGRGAGDLKNMPRHRRRVGVKSADSRIANRQIRGGHSRVECDAEDLGG